MYFKLIANDIKNSRLISATVVVFIFAASMLMAAAAGIGVRLVSSIDNLFEQAKTPHYMQMHAGKIDRLRLGRFVRDHPEIEAYLVSEFLNIEGAQIQFDGRSLADSVQDNGFVVQNESFDFLLDLENRPIVALPGEIYVPIYYMKLLGLSVGDKAKIAGREFTVAGFVRDSQMNAGLVSSKRFVVHETDLQSLEPVGVPEYLIEFRLSDLSQTAQLESDYINRGLESNGPSAITYALFRLINMIADAMMIAVLAIVGLLVILISFLCVRFTLLAKIEDEYKEIGILKAVGIPQRNIRRLYLAKYLFLAGIACVFGFLAAQLLQSFLIQNIELYMGKSDAGAVPGLFGVATSLIVFFMIYAYANGIVDSFDRISTADALRFGAPDNKDSRLGKFRLALSSLPGNIFLSVQELIGSKRVYMTMLAVLVVCVFIVTLPADMHHTFADRSFIGYLGLGDYDLRIDIAQMDGIVERAEEIMGELDADPGIASANLLISKIFDAPLDSGAARKIKIELGDHELIPVNYTQGAAPTAENEIALSELNAQDLEKKLGDRIGVIVDGGYRSFIVSGLYSDITNGGKTAKAAFESEGGAVLWAVIVIRLTDGVLPEEKLSVYRARFGDVKISDVSGYIDQTFGGTKDAIRKVALISSLMALVIAFTLTLLFMRMLYFKDRNQIAVLKAIGFRNADINLQYVIKAMIILALSLLIGIACTRTVGRSLGTLIFSIFNISGVRLLSSTVIRYFVAPLSIGISVALGTVLGVRGIVQLKISELIKE